MIQDGAAELGGSSVFSLNRDEAERIFVKLQISPEHSSDFVSGFVWIDGTPVLPVHYSNGNFHMTERVAFRFRRALRLSIDEFPALRDCHLSRDAYCELIRSRLDTEVAAEPT
jgi:hypothetical protein